MKVQKKHLIYVGALIAVVVVGAFLSGRGCSTVAVVEKPDTNVDTSEVDKKVDDKIEAEEKKTEAKIEKLEAEHADDIKEFDDGQRREFEAVKQKGPEAVADWLTDFNQGLGQ
jgi:Skp family chaperone for outer membrane proteins